jgi:hypothetical protein
MRFRYLAVLLLISLMAVPRASAEMRLTKRFSLDAETRYRSEIVDKDFNPDTGFNEFSALRTQLGATFVASRNVTLRFKIKETRYLGTTPSVTASSATLDFQEAYVKLDNALGTPLSMRFGRFEVAYGRNRLIGPEDWQNYGPRAYDGFLIELKTESGWWNVFYSKIAEGSFPEDLAPPLYDPVFSAHKGDRHLTVITGSMAKGLIQPLVMVDLDERLLNGIKKNNVITTAAVSSIYKSSRFAFEGDGAYQLGTYNDRDLSSWLVSVDLSYSMTVKIRPKIGLGADVTSGNKSYEQTSSDKDHVFYSPYGDRHIYKGYMDYFVDETNRYEQQGLIDSYFRFSFQPGSRYGIELTGHNFAFMENAIVGGVGFSPVGQEVDTRLIAVLARGFEFQAGYSVFLPGEKYASFIRQPDKKMGQFIYITIVGKL